MSQETTNTQEQKDSGESAICTPADVSSQVLEYEFTEDDFRVMIFPANHIRFPNKIIHTDIVSDLLAFQIVQNVCPTLHGELLSKTKEKVIELRRNKVIEKTELIEALKKEL